MKRCVYYLSMISLIIQFSLASNAFEAKLSSHATEGCRPWSQPGSCDRKPHVIFLVHGLMGSEGTFFDLNRILEQKYGTEKNINVINIEYPTNPHTYVDPQAPEALKNYIEQQTENWHPYNFVKIMNMKMIHYLVKQEILESKICLLLAQKNKTQLKDCLKNVTRWKSEYSLIVHSQGGLVSASFLNSCLIDQHKEYCSYTSALQNLESLFPKPEANEELIEEFGSRENFDSKRFDYYFNIFNKKLDPYRKNAHIINKISSPPNIKNLISLGSPFWGSPTANVASENSILLWAISNKNSLAIPQRQLIELAIGSRGLAWQRSLMLDRHNIQFQKSSNDFENTLWVNPYGDLKIYNVAGVIRDDRNTTDNSFMEYYGRTSTEALESQENSPIKDYFSYFYESTLAEAAKWTLINKFTRSPNYENDIIVGAPEARMDFIYNIEDEFDPLNSNKTKKGITSATTSYIPFPQSHVPLNKLNVYGMTQFIMKNEMYKVNYAYYVIENAFNSEFQLNPKRSKSNFDYIHSRKHKSIANFTSEIKLVTPIGYQRPLGLYDERGYENKITILNHDLSIKKNYLKNSLYITAHGRSRFASKMKYHYWQTYYHIGKFTDEYAYKPHQDSAKDLKSRISNSENKIDYDIKVHGFVPRTLSTQVLPSYTTYTEAHIKPYTLPFADSVNNNSVTDKVFATSGYKDFSMSKTNSQWKIKVSNTQKKNKNAKCIVGTIGFPTPDHFRHSQKAGADLEDIEKNGHSKFDRNNSFEVERFGIKVPFGEYVWQRYAFNQNRLYTQFDEAQYDHEKGPIKLTKYNNQLPTGEPVEVLGRFTTGYVDPFSGVGRACHAEEKNNNVSGECQKTSIDRYLITSPFIRKRDRIKSFKDLGIETCDNKICKNLGLRWVNVVDVDLYNPTYESLLVMKNNKTNAKFVVGKVKQISLKKDSAQKGLEHTDFCIKDSKVYTYASYQDYFAEYYSGSGGKLNDFAKSIKQKRGR